MNILTRNELRSIKGGGYTCSINVYYPDGSSFTLTSGECAMESEADCIRALETQRLQAVLSIDGEHTIRTTC